jgi:hypothetical protein
MPKAESPPFFWAGRFASGELGHYKNAIVVVAKFALGESASGTTCFASGMPSKLGHYNGFLEYL